MATKSSSQKKTVVLLDSHAIIHRAYHALPDFSSSKGEATGGLFGLSSMLIAIIKELKPDYVIAAYDLPKPTYRHQAFEQYKGGRKELDNDLISQITRSRDIFKAFNIPIYEKEGYEADDILGTIVEELKGDKDINVVIASGDMDTLQLIDKKKVQVYTLKKGIKDTIMYDEKGVLERFQFKPNMLIDYKGLRGDPSDNIPGVKGIGEKTATTLITKFGTLEKIYAHLKKKPEDFKKEGITERIQNLLIEHEEEAFFSKTLATIQCDVPITFRLPEKEWKKSEPRVSIEAIFDELEFRTLKNRLSEVLDGEEAAEAQPTMNIEADVSPIKLAEAQVALWLIDSTMNDPSLEDVMHVTGAKDFETAYATLMKEIKEKKLDTVFNDIELPLIPVIKHMEENGIKVDVDFLKDLSKTYHKELAKLEKEIWKYAGKEFNINSPKQLGEILFDELGLQTKKKTAGGAKSTKESVLMELKDEHPIIESVLEYRELQKLLSTYIDPIPEMLSEDGRLHARFLQTGTATGRMSSKDPNLQNIPVKTELGRAIRGGFVAEKGHTLVACDYSQIELRIAAILSGDSKLIEIFKAGKDVHSAVASQVFKVPEDKVDSEMRRRAKVINFGILYGMGVNALKQNLGTDRKEAQQFYNDYFDTYSELASYLESVKKETAERGYTETLFGRRRYFSGINSKLPFIRAAAERMAINAPIQGTQADIIKIAMSRIDALLEKKKLRGDVRLMLQIHDEVMYEIKDSLVDEIIADIIKEMEGVFTKDQTKGVPILVDIKTGKRWLDLKDYKKK